MYRLAPCLASLALSILPACKRGGDSNEPEPAAGPYVESSPTPTPEDVCRRLSELALADIGPVDPSIQQETIAMCAEQMRGEQQARTPESWDGVARCVVAARTDADIDRCDQLYPPPGGAAPSQPGTGGAQEEEVCANMLAVFAVEIAMEAQDAGEPVPELTEADIEQAFGECLDTLAEARQGLASPDYQALLGCLGNAGSGPAMEACLGE